MRFYAMTAVTLFLLGAVASGCGPSEPEREMGKVKGKVTYQDKPLTKGRVIFQSANGPPGVGELKEDGTYELETGVGPNKVSLQARDPNYTDQTTALPMLGKNHIPDKYETAEGSGLTADVQAGDGNTADFVLTD